MSSDRLISELKEAFDQLEQTQLDTDLAQIEKVSQGLRFKITKEKLLAVLSHVTSAIERRVGSTIKRIIDFTARTLLYRIFCVSLSLYRQLLRLEKEFLIFSVLTRLKINSFLFKNLHNKLNFQFIEPRLHHTNLAVGI